MDALRAGFSTAMSTYRGKALVPLGEGVEDWDEWINRAFRYLHARHYYWNTAYSQIAAYAEQQKHELKLYPHIRPIYNPVFRLVEGYVAAVWGGNLDYETLEEGAIPLSGLDDALAGAIRQLWRWSNWGQKKNAAIRTGAMLGDLPLKVVADVARGKVRMEVIDPVIIQAAEFDAMHNVKAVVIGYDRVDEAGRTYTYQEKIDGDSFATYRDGELYAYPENAVNGQAVAEWPNPYGFVPLVITPHRDVGKHFGGNAYAGLLPKINELNDQASKTNDYIRVALNPMYYAAGAIGPRDLTMRETVGEAGVATNIIYGPEGSSMTPLVSSADLAGALGAIDRMLAELEHDLPELSLPTIRQQGAMTAPGVRAGFTDAISRYAEARGQYDDGLVRAHQMGISIGAFHAFEGFEAFSLDSYRAGHLEHYVAERPVIEDTLSLLERVQTLQTTGAPAYLIWKLCGLSDKDVEAAWATKQATERTLASDFGRAVLSGALSTPDEAEGAI